MVEAERLLKTESSGGSKTSHSGPQPQTRCAMEAERLAAEEFPEIPVELDDLTHGRVHLVEEVSDYLYYSLDSWDFESGAASTLAIPQPHRWSWLT